MRLLAAAVLVALLAACGDDDDPAATATETEATSTTSESTTSTGPDGAETTAAPTGTAELLPLGELEAVATGLEVPWGMAFVDDETALVTERPGRVRVLEDGALRPDPVLRLDAVDEGEGGLLGIALHPDFPEERSAFLYYTAEDGNRVSRFDVAEDLTLAGEEAIITGIPAARFHDGGRIAFGPDDLLYVTTGDATQPQLAADVSSLAGKILRIEPDGTVPADNPFPDSPVYSYGHRNPQGLAWDADGTLYASEHGPSGEFGLCCHDELNRIEAGGFYGWPFLAGTVEAAGGEPPVAPIAPVATSGEDTWAPAGLAATSTGGSPSLLLATLASQELLRFDVPVGGSAASVTPEVAADGFGRLRISTVGPDGCLYVATSNTDGRGDAGPDDDRILRAC